MMINNKSNMIHQISLFSQFEILISNDQLKVNLFIA